MCCNRYYCRECGSNQNDWDSDRWLVWDPRAGEGRWVYRTGSNDGYRVGPEDKRRNWRPCNRQNRRADTGALARSAFLRG